MFVCMHVYMLASACVCVCTHVSQNEDLDDLLYDLSTARAGRLELVQPPGTGEAREQVSRAPVDDVAVPRPHSTQLTGLQQGLGPSLHLHPQAFLTLRELLLPGPPWWPGSFAFPGSPGGQRALGGAVGGQDDRVGHGSDTVGHVDARVAVLLLVMLAERAACWDVGDGEGMGQSRDILVPVPSQGPAAYTVALERRVELLTL